MKEAIERFEKEQKRKKFMDLATMIVKYQRFKSKVALEKMQDIDFNAKTRSIYFSEGCTYLHTKIRKKYTPSALYDCIDEVVNKCIQPLTPSVEDERRIYKKKYMKKNSVPPVATLDIVKQQVATDNIEYGIRVDNTIMLMPNREYALGFVDGLKYLNKKDAKVITVEMGDINE